MTFINGCVVADFRRCEDVTGSSRQAVVEQFACFQL